jgi:hypothetical protein
MAGRSSVSISAGNAQKVFTNNTGLPVVVSINAVSADSTKNPKCSIILSGASDYTLNFEAVKKTLPQNINYNTGDFDLVTKGDPIGSSILNFNTIGNDRSYSYFNGASSDAYQSTRYCQRFDPYFLDNPTAYNKDTAYGYIQNQGTADFHSDILKDKSFFGDRFLISAYSNNGTTVMNQQGFTYYQAAVVHDHWTDVGIGIHTNNNMSVTMAHDYVSGSNPTHQHNAATSNSFSYQYLNNSSGNILSNSYDDGLTLDLQADGGVFCQGVNGYGMTPTQHGRLGFLSFRLFRSNGSFEAGASSIKNAKDGVPSNNVNNLLTGGSYRAAINMSDDGGYLASWLKYNPHTDKYYMNIQGGIPSSLAGIYSVSHEDLFSTGNARSFSNVFRKESATNDLLHKTTQPMRIGDSLWVCFKSNTVGDALYSNDLVNWKTASDYLEIPDAKLIAVDNSVSPSKTLFWKGNTLGNKLFGIDSGFSAIPQSGLIENGVGIGTFERNGLVLGSGDSIYMENLDDSTAVHATATFVEV